MNFYLVETGYVLDEVTNIWSRPSYTGIAYNDGDEVEQRIAAIVEQASDITVLSTELRQYCTDWPSLYHLSGTRANILRPFEDELRGDILEIGAGCGAITRYLGECGGNVLALEGSKRRAAIARNRTRDLSNVTVVAEKFDDFAIEHQFDVITLIGVLEYANLFTTGDHPAQAMLAHVKKLLKPTGKLIIAIENQLGLKYFAGAPEDHIGQPMYGIEGRYRKDQPETFGRKVLDDMLEGVGFRSREFLAPFPDYKLPTSIVTKAGFESNEFDAAALISHSVRKDPQLPPILAFSPELVWPSLVQNELGMDMANSFLVVARNNDLKYSNLPVFAWHYSTERKEEFCKETRFLLNEKNYIDVKCRLLSSNIRTESNNELLKFKLEESSEYKYGKLLSNELLDLLTQDNWCTEDIADFFKRYLKILAFLVDGGLTYSKFSSASNLLPGCFFDAIPQNIIIKNNGSPQLIDQEWVFNQDIPLGFFIFKSIVQLLNSLTRIGFTQEFSEFSVINLLAVIFEKLQFELTENLIERCIKIDIAVHEIVTGKALVFHEILESLHAPIAVSISPWPLTGWQEQKKLVKQLERAEQAKAYAEQLAISRFQELSLLAEQLNRTEQAKAYAEQLAISRFQELSLLAEQLNRTEQAKAYAEQLAFARYDELNKIKNSIGYRLLTTLRIVPGKGISDV